MGRKLLCTSSRKFSPGVQHHKEMLFSGVNFLIWASNFNIVKEIYNNFKETLPTSLELFVPHKILRKNRTLNTATGRLNVLRQVSERHIIE